MTRVRKSRKNRGNKTGRGCGKKSRGAGNRGGRGAAGLHKHKWTWTVKYDKWHFKKPSLKPKLKKTRVINLSQINEMISKDNLKEIDLSSYKVLGSGKITKPITIKAESFSKQALEKINEAGGTANPIKETTEKLYNSKQPIVKG